MARFETATCRRCAGSGRYSFNQIDGDRCYGCGGTGVVLSKRGQAARAFFEASTQCPIESVAVGAFLWDTGFMGQRAKWLPVLEARESGASFGCGRDADGKQLWETGWELRTKRGGYAATKGTMVRAVANQAELDARIAAAVAHQATLGVNGKPLKRAAATAAA